MGRADDGGSRRLSKGKVISLNMNCYVLIDLSVRYDEALLKYLLLAELGYEVAQSNAAYILDRYSALKKLTQIDPGHIGKRRISTTQRRCGREHWCTGPELLHKDTPQPG